MPNMVKTTSVVDSSRAVRLIPAAAAAWRALGAFGVAGAVRGLWYLRSVLVVDFSSSLSCVGFFCLNRLDWMEYGDWRGGSALVLVK